MTQAERAEAFAALHEGGCFALLNAWDAGSARLLDQAGARALATTSAGAAWALGRRDGALTRAEALANARIIMPRPPCRSPPTSRMATARRRRTAR